MERKLLVLILNKVELLDELLEQFAREQIGGATILSSRGMARQLFSAGYGDDDDPIFGPLFAMLDPEREENRTILTVVPAEKVGQVIGVIEDVVGDLSEPDTGIVFTLPVSDVKGIS